MIKYMSLNASATAILNARNEGYTVIFEETKSGVALETKTVPSAVVIRPDWSTEVSRARAMSLNQKAG
jgi:hypothetical protein